MLVIAAASADRVPSPQFPASGALAGCDYPRRNVQAHHLIQEEHLGGSDDFGHGSTDAIPELEENRSEFRLVVLQFGVFARGYPPDSVY